MNKKRIAIVAGGSGGHIYPALSLADALKVKGYEITFIGANDRMEKTLIPETGYPFIGLDVKTTRGGALQKVKSLCSMVSSYFESKKLLKNQDMVIGFGNYISVPVIMAAKAMHIPTAIHEQNSYVGRANRYLDEKVDLVIGSYEENRVQFKNKHTLIIGNPQSSSAADKPFDPMYLSQFGLDPHKKTVLIFFGSLGSESVMKHVLDYIKTTKGDYQILYAAGSKHVNAAKSAETAWAKIVERVDGVQAMRASTILLSRAGATTLAEITAIGIPSVLIPSPYVPNNHQYFNAKALTDKGAAVLLEEKDLNADSIRETVEKLLNDDIQRQSIREKALSLSHADVLKNIVEEVEKLWI